MKKVATIEFLRFVSAIIVILYHYKQHIINLYNSSEFYRIPFYSNLHFFFDYGFYAVQLFFCISGFVFAIVYLDNLTATSVKKFALNRFARLYPLHLATLLLIIILQYLIPDYFNTSLHKKYYNDFYHFFLNIFLISFWGIEKGFSFNTPIWSVSIEILAYIIFFISINFLKKYKIYFTSLIIFLFFFIYKIKIFINILDINIAQYFLLFFFGVLIWQIKKVNKLILTSLSLSFLTISFIGNFKIILFCPALLMLVVLMDEYIKNNKIRDIFLNIGNVTYAIYLIHFPIMIIIFHYDANNYLFFNKIFLIVFIIFLILFSLMINFYFEKPLNKIIKKIYYKY